MTLQIYLYLPKGKEIGAETFQTSSHTTDRDSDISETK
jgi:hypothetical protein